MTKTIGIIGAMEEEICGLVENLEKKNIISIGKLKFITGEILKKSVVVVQCGIGKVNAAMCSQLLIDYFSIDAIINTGLAGGINPQVNIGDIIISDYAVYHDFDTTAFGYEIGEVPGLNRFFSADKKLQTLAFKAANEIVGEKMTHLGIVASGDQFISSTMRKEEIANTYNALCAEMEGTAIAHVAYLNNCPYVIIRTISDQADNTAPENFDHFKESIIPNLNRIVKFVLNYYE